MKQRPLVIALFFMLMLLPLAVQAEPDSLCPDNPVQLPAFSSDGKIHLSADHMQASEDNISRFQGNVIIQQKNARIEAEQAEYQRQGAQLQARGQVRFINPEIVIHSEQAKFQLKQQRASLTHNRYRSVNSRAQGEAEKIELLNSHEALLTNATYTTCNREQTDWLMSANSINLNSKTHQGHATHVVLRFKDVPFFYFPYLRFPLGEERLSGFLFPYIGNSNIHGSELHLPYYWNIHPQMDATLTPRLMSRRGLLLQSEFRYLGNNQQGIIKSEYIDHDRVFNARRQRWQWQHQTRPGDGWQFRGDYNYVADAQHLTDFGNTLDSSSTTYLTRRGDLFYRAQDWIFNISAEDNQILSGDPAYKRLPQIGFKSLLPQHDNHFNFAFSAEAVHFAHVDGTKVTGDRLHLKPEISYPYRSNAGFVDSKLSWQLTRYTLKNNGNANQLYRSLPTFSINSGLFFERDSTLFSSRYLQTLEPQLFYVYVPYQDQSLLPIFDTSNYSYNINQPFADYRFNGIDRIGDDNRLTTALATRLIRQDNGAEIFMARVGQIHYFSPRQVQLDNSTDVRSRSNLIAEIRFLPGNWTLTTQLEWDPFQRQMVNSSSAINYHNSRFNIALAHRLQRDTLETTEIGINWKISDRWKWHNRYLYNNRDQHLIENSYGLDYDSCCWGLRLSSKQRYLSSSQMDNGIYLELILKGLGGFGIRQ